MADAVVMEAVAKHFRSGGRRFSALHEVHLSVSEGQPVAVSVPLRLRQDHAAQGLFDGGP